jgi:hypothetical protein
MSRRKDSRPPFLFLSLFSFSSAPRLLFHRNNSASCFSDSSPRCPSARRVFSLNALEFVLVLPPLVLVSLSGGATRKSSLSAFPVFFFQSFSSSVPFFSGFSRWNRICSSYMSDRRHGRLVSKLRRAICAALLVEMPRSTSPALCLK